MRRLDETVERNWAAHERLWVNQERSERNIDKLHASMLEQKQNVDKLLGAVRELIDRIPPENLR